jgi:hypothetical protein
MNPDMTARGKRTTLWIPGSRSRDRYGGPPYPDPGRLIRPTTWIPRRRDAVPIFKPSYPCGGMDTGTGGWTWRPRSAIPDHLPDDRRLGRARPEHPGRCRFSSVSTELRASSPPSGWIHDLQAEASCCRRVSVESSQLPNAACAWLVGSRWNVLSRSTIAAKPAAATGRTLPGAKRWLGPRRPAQEQSARWPPAEWPTTATRRRSRAEPLSDSTAR